MFNTVDSTRFPVRLLTAGLLGGLLLLVAASRPAAAPPPPVYSMAAVWAGLERSPGGWVGRTVHVRAVVGHRCVTWMDGGNPACISWRPEILDPSAPKVGATLPLRGVPPSPLLAALRRLPLTAWLAPAPQQIRWDVLTTYRVLLQATPSTVCGAPACYEALLLDAAPGSL